MVTLKRGTSCGRREPGGVGMETSRRASSKLRSMAETEFGSVVGEDAATRRFRCEGRESNGDAGMLSSDGAEGVCWREVEMGVPLKYCAALFVLGDTTGVSLAGVVTLEPPIEGIEGTRLLLFLGICKGGT